MSDAPPDVLCVFHRRLLLSQARFCQKRSRRPGQVSWSQRFRRAWKSDEPVKALTIVIFHAWGASSWVVKIDRIGGRSLVCTGSLIAPRSVKAGRSFVLVTVTEGSCPGTVTGLLIATAGHHTEKRPSEDRVTGGNRESAPFPVTVTGPPFFTMLRPTLRSVPTLEATQWQILSQSPTDATRFWWHLYGC